MIKTLKKLFPKGLAWLFPDGYMSALITALAIVLDDTADFLSAIATEANPETATDTLEDWFDQYGMLWTDEGGVKGKQELALSRFVSLGGQDMNYFQRMIDEAGFSGVLVSETYPDEYIIAQTDWANIFETTLTTDASYAPDGTETALLMEADDEPAGTFWQGMGVTKAYGASTANKVITLEVWLRTDELPEGEDYLPVTIGIGVTLLSGRGRVQEVTDKWKLFKVRYIVPSSATSTNLIGTVAFELLKDEKGEYIGGRRVYVWGGRIAEHTASYSSADDIFKFNVTGEVDSPLALDRLYTIIQRISPAHCHPDITGLVVAGNVWGEGLYGEAICFAN